MSGYPHHDAVVRRWFQKQGWPVSDSTRKRYGSGLEVVAWRHEATPTSHTLRIDEHVLRHFGSDELESLLDDLDVADAIRRDPAAYTVVVEERGAAKLHQWEGDPAG